MKTAERWQRLFAIVTVVVMAMQFSIAKIVYAETVPLQVVINEVTWAGSADSSADEWIELYNNSNVDVDLNGWYIEDDYSSSYYLNGVIKAHGYFVIEDSENVISNRVADLVLPLSLANAGDSLVLKTGFGDIIDSVNAEGGAWYAGDSTTKASMERVDPTANGNDAGNWASSLFAGSYKYSLGTPIIGTPGEINSVFNGVAPLVTINASDAKTGAEMTVNFTVDSVSDLYSYGFDVVYDPQVVEFVGASAGTLLGNSEDKAFYAALENNVPGKVIVGSARLGVSGGVDASGELFSLKFKAISTVEKQSSMTIVSGFMANSNGEVIYKTKGADFLITGQTVIPPVTNFKAVNGERYSFLLTWDDMGVEKYQVLKKMPDNSWKLLGEITDKQFLENGVEISAGVEYEYAVQVFGEENSRVTAKVKEIRGIKGDLNKSDRVDGKDLDALARSFATAYGDGQYKLLNDLNYDGLIDGNDLIDIGVSFGLVYNE